MELVYTCRGCNRDRVLDSEAKTREEIAIEGGGCKIEVYCPFCEINHHLDVNHITAVKTTFEIWAPGIYWFITVVILVQMLAASMLLIFIILLLGSFLIPFFMIRNLENSISTFNKSRSLDYQNNSE